MVLLLVIFITNVPLRGMWSAVVIVLIVLWPIIFELAGFWEPILHTSPCWTSASTPPATS